MIQNFFGYRNIEYDLCYLTWNFFFFFTSNETKSLKKKYKKPKSTGITRLLYKLTALYPFLPSPSLSLTSVFFRYPTAFPHPYFFLYTLRYLFFTSKFWF